MNEKKDMLKLIVVMLFVSASQLFAAPVADIVVAKDGSGDVATLQDAFNKVPSNNTKEFVIYVKKGTYKQKVKLASGKNNVTLIGEDAATTIFTYDDYSAIAGGTNKSWSVLIEANDFVARNVTFENTIDSRLSQYKSNGQGVALQVTGDRIAFYDCIIKGFQDTYFNAGKGRCYTKDCTIKGTTDFIFGSGINILEDCTIINLKSSATTAASNKNAKNKYNYLFLHCELKAEGSLSVTLGRPWGAEARVVFFECVEGAHIKSDGWQNWSSADYSKTAYFAEYKCTGAGYQPSKRISWSHQLTDQEATQYTVANLFSKNANDDGYSSDWMPSIPNNANPVVSITSPTTGKSFDEPANVTLSANASDNGSIASVEFFNGSTSLQKVTSSPYTYTWSNVAKGSYTITAVATDNEGNKTTSSAVTFSATAPKVPGIFVYANTSGDLQYATGSNWDQGSTPTATDTAIIRSGEAQLKANVNEMIKVEPNGILRMVGFFTVPKVILQGGALQVNTSNTTYGLKAAVNVEKSSSIIAGSNAITLFNSEITFTGSKNLEKTSGGTVALKSSSPAYTGKWIISEGTLSCAATHATGIGSIVVKNGAILISDVTGSIAGTDSLILESGSKLKVNAVDTVQFLITNGTSLKSGTYTASTLSQYLEGSGSLVVLKDGDSSTSVANYVYDATVLRVYPNPIKDIGTVTYSVDNTSTIKVYDAHGNVQAAKKVKGSGAFIFSEFGISMNGTYTVTIRKGNVTYFERVFFTK